MPYNEVRGQMSSHLVDRASGKGTARLRTATCHVSRDHVFVVIHALDPPQTAEAERTDQRVETICVVS